MQNADVVERLKDLLDPCELCPRLCRVHRRGGELGFCRTGANAQVASAGPHPGEERVLSGRHGSGTIFFAGCNLRCVFCQNWDISHEQAGREASAREVADTMLALERRGCHNINLVTPTHVAHVVAEAVAHARAAGLCVPVVYNCGGYERVETLRLLSGLVDIYMPDVKFFDPQASVRYCHARDYPEVVRAAVQEMHRQKGDLRMQAGLAVQGLLVRHLVMPGRAREGCAIMGFLADEVSSATYVNVMGQYRPCYEAEAYPDLDRRPARPEIEAVREHARNRGLRLD